MKPAVLLIDLQNDFLGSPVLEPAAGQIVWKAAQLLADARARGIPVIHVWTSVRPEDDRRMPHWKRVDKRSCVVGTAGHATPVPLRPVGSEAIIHKTFFSAFSTGELDPLLHALGVDTLILAGVHLHGCIRATAIDAYQRGFEVRVVEDAVGSDDPLHAAVTRRYLEGRAAVCCVVESCWAATPGDGDQTVADTVDRAAQDARQAWPSWRKTSLTTRREILLRLARSLDADGEALARDLATEIGKPLTLACAELKRSVALLHAAVENRAGPLDIRCTAGSVKRFRPLGVVATVTPWNNPVAIPLGKIAPALMYGNTVVWKPSPAASSITAALMEHLRAAGCPEDVVTLVSGGSASAIALMSHPAVDAVTITGSPLAGYSALDVCGRRHLPLQAELGGNNAAIVWSDCDLRQAAAEIADAAFAFAGQRWTANRRVIVEESAFEQFLEFLQSATATLVVGDPLDEQTRVGPLISIDKSRELSGLIERSRCLGARILTPHKMSVTGSYFTPTIVCCDDPSQEVVQEESFGPVLVVQRANDWQHALQLCNGVRQGLVASLFSAAAERQESFLDAARAGILKLNLATADANVEAPFGGWKASGVGPPEHGDANREFYTRAQAVYRA